MRYADSVDNITEAHVTGLFSHWGTPPSPAAILAVLRGSDHVVVALEEDGRVLGYITAITDGVSAAYIPHLEVRPEGQGRGIGSELVRRMLDRLRDLYMIDLICDEHLNPFYERLGFRRWNGMIVRNYDRQSLSQSSPST
ncbi:MAG: GNAT family N-acetyltransferase [Capsulimonadales bacterium]|nr:GNAT family N-acetyltransferase [Capsulimonadales bacterium]